ncbi:TonB family protein [Oscillatoria sp. CS-180]|uniref:TonB family protein n=1 Tax=Oscillatoria sp. CS-180 TaxID=3021720 RepID=UPI00233127A9|nr:TonB family protein [Oscillatoria sp. CS-180]MDB9528313.1 TonB family protein [Oscillatoria sp. CS-180]
MRQRFSLLGIVGAIAAFNTILISPARAQIRQITRINVIPSDHNLVIHLEATNADQATILQTYVGNKATLDLLVTQLSEGLDAFQSDPIHGIRLISIEPLDTNSVRIRIVGSAGEPTVEISQEETRIVLTVTPERSVSCRYCPRPDYPESALDNRIEGTVLLRVEFDAEGYVTGASINQSSGNAMLDQAALEAVSSYEFDLHQNFNDQGGSVLLDIVFVIQ